MGLGRHLRQVIDLDAFISSGGRHGGERARAFDFRRLDVLRYRGADGSHDTSWAEPGDALQVRSHGCTLAFQGVTVAAPILGVEEQRLTSLDLRLDGVLLWGGSLCQEKENPKHCTFLLSEVIYL